MAKRSMFNELKQGLQEMKAERQGKITLKTIEVELPKPIKMSKTRIRRIRSATNYSQSVFARVLGANVKTYQKWEQGLSEPNEQAKLLLEMVDRDHHFLETLAGVTVGSPKIIKASTRAEPKAQAAIKAPAKKKAAAKRKAAAKKAPAKRKAKAEPRTLATA